MIVSEHEVIKSHNNRKIGGGYTMEVFLIALYIEHTSCSLSTLMLSSSHMSYLSHSKSSELAINWDFLKKNRIPTPSLVFINTESGNVEWHHLRSLDNNKRSKLTSYVPSENENLIWFFSSSILCGVCN